MKLKRSIASLCLLAALVVIASGFSCDAVKTSAVANNRYAESLSHFQDAVKTAHEQGSVDDATYRKLMDDEDLASQAGRNLDAAIGVAANGGDPSQYVDAAQTAFDQLVADLKPTNSQSLLALSNVSGALLKNVISAIQAIKAKPAAAPSGGGLAFWLLGFGLIGTVAISADGIVQLLTLALALEPAAVDLLIKLATSLKGKTAAEVLAMNEALFAKIEQTNVDERAKLDAQKGS